MPTILLLIANEALAYALRMTLLDEGYGAEGAPDVPTATALLATTPIDLVLTDLSRPPLTATANWLHDLRRAASAIPIVLLTTHPLDSAWESEGDVTDVLVMPFDLPDFLAVIARHVASPGQA